MNPNKTNLIVDIILFTAYLIVSSPALTGNTLHEWISLALIATILIHLLLHWQWLVKITLEFFKKMFHTSRLNWLINFLFFTAFTGATVSGILISKDVLAFFGIQLTNVPRTWEFLHRQTADLSVLLLGIHIALHWKWILHNLHRYTVLPLKNLFKRQLRPAVQPVQVREK